MIDPENLINEYYRPGSRLADILLDHSRRVRDKALEVARRVTDMPMDLTFIEHGAMLHDIGIFQTDAASILCHGDQPYLRHGVIGRKLLERHDLDQLALVCERHVGVGITEQDIVSHQLPLPKRDMTPQTTEEIIICYADKFFTKTNGGHEKPVKEVIAQVAKYGKEKAAIFKSWHERFESF